MEQEKESNNPEENQQNTQTNEQKQENSAQNKEENTNSAEQKIITEKDYNQDSQIDNQDDMISTQEEIEEEILEHHIPITKVIKDKAHVVGIMSFAERDSSNVIPTEIREEQQEQIQPIHLYPPKLFLLNFLDPQNKEKNENENDKQQQQENYKPSLKQIKEIYEMDYKKNKRVAKLINKQYIFGKEKQQLQKSLFYDSFGLWIEENTIGKALVRKEKEILYKGIMKKFFAFAAAYPPCCDRGFKLWQHIFLVNPDSKFIWGFKQMDFIFLDYLTDFLEFREVFSLWLDSFSDIIIDEYSKTPESRRVTEYFFTFLRSMVTAKNQKFMNEILNRVISGSVTLPDKSHFIKNNGIYLKPLDYNQGVAGGHQGEVQHYQCKKGINSPEFLMKVPLRMPTIKVRKQFKLNFKKSKELYNYKIQQDDY